MLIKNDGKFFDFNFSFLFGEKRIDELVFEALTLIIGKKNSMEFIAFVVSDILKFYAMKKIK